MKFNIHQYTIIIPNIHIYIHVCWFTIHRNRFVKIQTKAEEVAPRERELSTNYWLMSAIFFQYFYNFTSTSGCIWRNWHFIDTRCDLPKFFLNSFNLVCYQYEVRKLFSSSRVSLMGSEGWIIYRIMWQLIGNNVGVVI